MVEHRHFWPTPKQCQQYRTWVSPSSRFSTPTISACGQFTATSGGNIMLEATSCMWVAHWVKLFPSRSTVVDPAKGCDPGGGGGTANREPALRALFSRSVSTEASNGASKRVTYRLAPRVSDSAWGNFHHVGSLLDPNLMYSSLQ